jgi:predicted nucleotidyltransferase
VDLPEPQRHAVSLAAEFFGAHDSVDAVLLVGSWAHGHGAPGSDVDIGVLSADVELAGSWERSAARARVRELLSPVARYDDVDVAFVDGDFAPAERGWTTGPDEFELELGNYIAYSVPLVENSARFAQLRDTWLPFYDDALREARLADALMYCRNDLDHIPWALGRGDRFHAFDRLYHAHQELLQALFITRRVYPLAYDKWVGVQLRELLGLPDLGDELATIVFGSIADGCRRLEELVDSLL